MGGPRVATIELAQKLIASEELNVFFPKAGTNAWCLVIERLRVLLTRFAGLEGYVALMRRAIALSRVEHPSVDRCVLGKDGVLASPEDIPVEAGSKVVAQLLDLMTPFIGEALTLSLLASILPVETAG